MVIGLFWFHNLQGFLKNDPFSCKLFYPISGLNVEYQWLVDTSGLTNYFSHEGSRPISFIWELEYPMPAHLVREAAHLSIA